MVIFISVLFGLVATLVILFYQNHECFKKGIVIQKSTITMVFLSLFVGVALFLLSYYHYNDSIWYTVKLACLYELLVAVAYVDYKKRIIPNRLILCGLALWILDFILEVAFHGVPFLDQALFSFIGLLLGGGVFSVCRLVAKGGVGMGDVKLFAMLGLALGWRGVFNVIFYSVFAVMVYGIFVMIKYKRDKRSLVPIGPFALFGMIVVMLLGI